MLHIRGGKRDDYCYEDPQGAGRFFIVAGALRVFGDKIEKNIEQYFDILSVLFVILLVGGFLALKYLK